jgi:hypothetical protein
VEADFRYNRIISGGLSWTEQFGRTIAPPDPYSMNIMVLMITQTLADWRWSCQNQFRVKDLSECADWKRSTIWKTTFLP